MYDRESAVAYAHEWAMNRNPKYFSFNGIGGDCTNFISQCVHAGGAPQNYTPDTGWYYNSPTDRAAAWTSVEHFYQFLMRQHEIGPKGRQIPLEEVQIGDVIQLSFLAGQFSHSLLVVDVGDNTNADNVLIATHSDNSDNRPLSSYYFRDYRCLNIYL